VKFEFKEGMEDNEDEEEADDNELL